MAKRNIHWDVVCECVTHETDAVGATTVTYTQESRWFGSLIRENRAGTEYYQCYDALGSTIILTDDAAVVTVTFIYDAWGNVVASTGSTSTPCGRTCCVYHTLSFHARFIESLQNRDQNNLTIFSDSVTWLQRECRFNANECCSHAYVSKTSKTITRGQGSQGNVATLLGSTLDIRCANGFSSVEEGRTPPSMPRESRKPLTFPETPQTPASWGSDVSIELRSPSCGQQITKVSRGGYAR